MSEHERITPDLKAFEAMLGGLAPAAPALDRDRLMYEAGRASRDHGSGRGWPVATLCVGLIALVLGRATSTSPVSGPEGFVPADRKSQVVVEQPASTPLDEPRHRSAPQRDSWLRLRKTLDDDGLASLGPRDHRAAPPDAPAPANWLEGRRALPEYWN